MSVLNTGTCWWERVGGWPGSWYRLDSRKAGVGSRLQEAMDALGLTGLGLVLGSVGDSCKSPTWLGLCDLGKQGGEQSGKCRH